MKPDILILRPQPGANETARRARALGLKIARAPLFRIEPVAWSPPDPSLYDAVLFTSANAARQAGPQLAGFTHLPCYAVGPGTAHAASKAGFTAPHIGPADGDALLIEAQQDGRTRLFHPCGRVHIPLHRSGLHITHCAVYYAQPMNKLPAKALAALRDGAIALLHSPEAAACFARLADAAEVQRAGIRLVAISRAAAAAADKGWRSIEVATRPRDEALVELAATLCKNSSGR